MRPVLIVHLWQISKPNTVIVFPSNPDVTRMSAGPIGTKVNNRRIELLHIFNHNFMDLRITNKTQFFSCPDCHICWNVMIADVTRA